jgi:hypothetical protein
MKRIMPNAAPATALAFALSAGAAGAASTVVIVDPALSETFEEKRQIVDVIRDVYGSDAVYANGNDLPGSVASEIATGETVPADAAMTPVPQSTAMRLPQSEPGTRWVEIGEHLVEIDDDDVAHLVVYDVVR